MKRIAYILFLFTAITVQAQCWKQVAGGNEHKVGIKEDGTIWTWGSNEYGQLGDGTTQNSLIPINIVPGDGWKFVDAGIEHTIALKNDGTLWGWGSNEYNQLGTGTNQNSLVPIQIGTDNDWKVIDVGGYHNFAIKNDGTLWGWGLNNYSQLGDGTTINKNTPTKLGIETWRSVVGGSFHSAGIKGNGTLYTWGLGAYGQLGSGSYADHYNVPIQISFDTDWETIYCASEMTVIIKTDGTLWGCGDLFGASLIQKGENFTIASLSVSVHALKNDGTLWGFGDNASGQIGNGTTIEYNDFVKVNNDTDWKLPITGGYSSGALKTDGALYTWGYNGKGQGGNGNTTTSYIPVVVECPTASLNENTLSNISIYPNPTDNTLNISNTGNINIETLKVIDVTGKILLEQQSNTSQIDVQKLPAGMYFLEITANGAKQYTKFIKK